MKRVSVIGSGNVGANTAFFIAERGAAEVLLTDIREGVSKGKALDIEEASPIRFYRTRVSASDSIEAIAGSDVVAVSAGNVRKPGMKREDLYEENEGVIREAARNIKAHAPRSAVIVVTEPVDLLTALFVEESGFPRERVMGAGGILDALRLRYALARDLGVAAECVSALALGPHDEDLICPGRYVRVSGVPVLSLIHADQFEALVGEVRRSGDFIVEMAKQSSSYYAPSAAIAELADAVVRDTKRVFPVSVRFAGEYGIDGVAMSLPAVIGEKGIERILLPELTGEELQKLLACARRLGETRARRTRG